MINLSMMIPPVIVFVVYPQETGQPMTNCPVIVDALSELFCFFTGVVSYSHIGVCLVVIINPFLTCQWRHSISYMRSPSIQDISRTHGLTDKASPICGVTLFPANSIAIAMHGHYVNLRNVHRIVSIRHCP